MYSILPKWSISQYAAAVALVGSALPVLSKVMEMISTSSLESKRSKGLQRVQELLDQIGKVKSQSAASQHTIDSVAAQIEEEIQFELTKLQKSRQRNLQVKKPTNADLGFVQRLFLLFRPVGLLGWIINLLAYAVGFFASACGLLALSDIFEIHKQGGQFWTGVSVAAFFGVIFISLRWWALSRRAHKQKTAPPYDLYDFFVALLAGEE